MLTSADLFYDPTKLYAALAVTIVAMVLFCGLAALVARRVAKDSDSELPWVAAGLAAMVAMLLGVIALAVFADPERTAQENQLSWAQEQYGISLSQTQLSNLEFPRYPPAEDDAFGITAVNQDGNLVTVQLVWEDGEFGLLGTDGQSLLPLPSND